MANILILGGGFGGVVAAEELAKRVGSEHQLTLVSRSSSFVFYPALVRLVFGHGEAADVSYDLREAMLDRRIRFIESEVARVDPHGRIVTTARGEVAGELPYDYLIFALGRRLATERVTGFYEHAHHLLTVEAALKFGASVRAFTSGRAVVGYCPEARLSVPVYETAFALSRLTEGQKNTTITLVSPEAADRLNGTEMPEGLRTALDEHGIEFLPDFPIEHVSAGAIETAQGRSVGFDLLMLVPPFQGPSPVIGEGITDEDGYVQVDHMMRVRGVERMYAVGDCVNFEGPKMGHMAVRQASVAARNLADELEGVEPSATYEHEIKVVIDEGGKDSLYLHENLWADDEQWVGHGRFWRWAKRVQEIYWKQQHS